jgi:hypothetical protein
VTFMDAMTPSVSAKIVQRLTVALSVVSVRLSTCLVGPGRPDWQAAW